MSTALVLPSAKRLHFTTDGERPCCSVSRGIVQVTWDPEAVTCARCQALFDDHLLWVALAEATAPEAEAAMTVLGALRQKAGKRDFKSVLQSRLDELLQQVNVYGKAVDKVVEFLHRIGA